MCVLVDVSLAWQDHLVLLASQFLVMLCPAFRLFNIRITFFSEYLVVAYGAAVVSVPCKLSGDILNKPDNILIQNSLGLWNLLMGNILDCQKCCIALLVDKLRLAMLGFGPIYASVYDVLYVCK